MRKNLGIAADRAEVLARLRTVRPDSQRTFGTLTAPEMVVHLADAFRVALGLRAASTVRWPRWKMATYKWIGLNSPSKWPTGFPTRPEVDPRRKGTRPGDFAEDMREVERLTEQFVATEQEMPGPHPAFGRMSIPEWRRWGYLHMDHHLRQFGA